MDLRAITPELMLAVLGLGLLVIELVTGPGEKHVLAWVGILGLLLALVPSVGLLSAGSRLVFAQTYAVDPFAAFFKVIAILSGILVLGTAMEFFQAYPSRHEGDVYCLIVFLVLGLVLMAASADLILLFLAIEFVSLVSYALAGSLKTDRRSNEAGVKYFLFGAVASALMLYGFTYLYGASGTTNLYRLAAEVARAPGALQVLAAGLVLAGLGFKVSLVPFHQWTPDVYEGAPTPITALLSVGSKAAGFAVLLRVLYVALPSGVWVALLAVLAALSMSMGNLVALAQQNIKRMLAYSSIAHAGYMLIGVVALQASPSPLGSGIGAVLYYLLAYTFTTLGAFAVAIVVERHLRSDAIPDYGGLSQRAPFTALAMAVFMLSLTGVPPTALFVGKLFLFASAIHSGLLWLAVVGILNSVISLYYYVGVIRAMYLQAAPEGARPLRESLLARLVLGVTVAGTLALGVYPEPFLRLSQSASVFFRL